VIAATNANLDMMVERGTFRRDLYYRLKVVTIHVPALRDRRADLPELIEGFLDELSRANAVPRKRVAPAVLEALSAYDWPGNVRELKNVLESVLVASPGRRSGRGPPALDRPRRGPSARPMVAVGTTLESMERELIRPTLESRGETGPTAPSSSGSACGPSRGRSALWPGHRLQAPPAPPSRP
jgi:DNA-binding NtrC family response regulator